MGAVNRGEDSWTWADGEAVSGDDSYTNWRGNDKLPLLKDANQDYCMLMIGRRMPRRVWWRFPCDMLAHFVCQTPAIAN